MIARVAIAETGREIEVAIDDRDSFVKQIEKSLSGGDGVLWVTDTKGSSVGIPVARIAYVEIADDDGQSVGFSR